MLSGFTRQQLKPFLSVGKRQDLPTLATRPLDEAAGALRYVGAGHTRGKVVITT